MDLCVKYAELEIEKQIENPLGLFKTQTKINKQTNKGTKNHFSISIKCGNFNKCRTKRVMLIKRKPNKKLK